MQEPLHFPELCIWKGCNINITDNLEFYIYLRGIFEIC